MIRKTTINMCGTLGPYGIAVTSLRPSFLASRPGEVSVVKIPERQCYAESGKDPAVDDVRRKVDDMQAQSGQHNDVQNDIGEQSEKPVPIARDPPARGIG